MTKPQTFDTRVVMKRAIEKFNQNDFLGAVEDYEDLLAQAPNFISALLKNGENRRFHEVMAKHSLLQQAFKQSRNEGYSVDIGPYLFSKGGKMRIGPSVAEDIGSFKGVPFKGSATWASHLSQVQAEYRDTLLSGSDNPETIEWSPAYLAHWVLNDFFQIAPFIPKTVHRIADIGCGIGCINVLISQVDGNSKQIGLYDIDEDCLRSARTLLADNGISTIVDDQPYDLVISMRSCCYIYDYNEYEDLFLNRTRQGTCIIVDIKLEKLEKTLSFFGEFCEFMFPLESGNTNQHRYVLIR